MRTIMSRCPLALFAATSIHIPAISKDIDRVERLALSFMRTGPNRVPEIRLPGLPRFNLNATKAHDVHDLTVVIKDTLVVVLFPAS